MEAGDKNQKNPRKTLSPPQIAKLFGVAHQTVLTWMKNGDLPAYQTPGGRYCAYEDEVKEQIEALGVRMPADGNSDDEKDQKTYSPPQIAELFGVAHQTVLSWIKKEQLPSHKTMGGRYRVYEDDLTEAMKRMGVRMTPEMAQADQERTQLKALLIAENDNGLASEIRKVIKEHYPDATIEHVAELSAIWPALFAQPQVIILNANMPGDNWITVCGKIREQETIKQPIIIITAHDRIAELQTKAEEVGADAFISIPFDPQIIPDRLRLIRDYSVKER